MAVQLANRYHKLVCCRNETDQNASRSSSKTNISVNATLHLILMTGFGK